MSERVLLFPEDVAVGRVFAYRGEDEIGAWPARARVRVPSDASVHLVPACPVRGLGSLGPDDVETLALPKKTATDTDLSRLSHLTGLRSLDCSKAHDVTDAGLRHVAALRELRHLDLYRSSVTDAGLVHLAGLTRLRHLHLGFTRVEGPGIAHLAKLRSLERLSLEETDVDDSAVPHLLALPMLGELVLDGTRFTGDGIATLRSGLPRASVHMLDPGRRASAERSERKVLQILARRLRPDLADEALQRGDLRSLLPPTGRIAAVRYGSESFHLTLSFEDLHRLAELLAGLPPGYDLRVVAPPSFDGWVPWLRQRGSERRDPR